MDERITGCGECGGPPRRAHGGLWICSDCLEKHLSAQTEATQTQWVSRRAIDDTAWSVPEPA